MTLLSTNQVAERVGLSPTTIRIYSKDGRFPAPDETIDRRHFWLETTVLAYRAEKKESA